MTDEHETDASAAPNAEVGQARVEPDLVEPTERWPTVVGVLGIVFASLGMLAFVCGLLGPVIGNFFVGIVPEEQREQLRTQIETQRRLSLPYPVVQYGVQLIEFALAIVLLVGAIQILRRSRGGAKTLTRYAWLDLIWNFIGAGVGLVVVTGMQNAMKTDPTLAKSAGPLGPGFMMPMVIVGFVLQGIWPAFLILWFGRDPIKDAVDRWDGGVLEVSPPPLPG